MPKSTRNPIIHEIAKALGGYKVIAAELCLSKGAVSAWSEVPAEYVLRLERLSGIRREVIRPDVFAIKAA